MHIHACVRIYTFEKMWPFNGISWYRITSSGHQYDLKINRSAIRPFHKMNQNTFVTYEKKSARSVRQTNNITSFKQPSHHNSNIFPHHIHRKKRSLNDYSWMFICFKLLFSLFVTTIAETNRTNIDKELIERLFFLSIEMNLFIELYWLSSVISIMMATSIHFEPMEHIKISTVNLIQFPYLFFD